MPALSDVSLGFRSAYLDYERLTAQLRAWVDAFPKLARGEFADATLKAQANLALA